MHVFVSLKGFWASKLPQVGSKLAQVGLLEQIWAQVGSKLAPSWLKLGPSWVQVGSMLAHVGPMLGTSWLQVNSSWCYVGPNTLVHRLSWRPHPPGPPPGTIYNYIVRNTELKELRICSNLCWGSVTPRAWRPGELLFLYYAIAITMAIAMTVRSALC